jgi:H+/gluconate symporter-like permease
VVIVTAFGAVRSRFAEGTRSAVGGALLASMNTASEYGFGGVIAALPGFLVVSDAAQHSQSAGQRGGVGQHAGGHTGRRRAA